jgi:hypothetical protein
MNTYKKNWIGWGDFLGSGNIGTTIKENLNLIMLQKNMHNR